MGHTCDLIRGDKSKGDLVAGGEQDVFLAGSSTPASVFLPGATLIHIIFMDHTITNVQIVKYCTQCALEIIHSSLNHFDLIARLIFLVNLKCC